MATWSLLKISLEESLRRIWRNLSFQSKSSILLVTCAAVPLFLMTEGMVILFERALVSKIYEGLENDLQALSDEVDQAEDMKLAQAANLAEQVQIAQIDLRDSQASTRSQPLIDRIFINYPNTSFAILTDTRGRSVAQNIQLLTTAGNRVLPASAKSWEPRYQSITVPIGIALDGVPIVRSALTTQRPLVGTELLQADVLQQLGLSSQAEIGLRPQLTKNLSLAQQPSPLETYNIDQGKVGLVQIATQPIWVNQEFVGVAVVGTVLNQNYTIVDRIKQRYEVPTVTLFAQDWRVSTNVPYVNPQTGQADQTRAIGTRVAREVAATVLNQGRNFLGRTNIVGANYFTVYSPLYDHRQQLTPQQAKPIGMLYVGEPAIVVEDFLAWKRLLSYGLGGSILLVVGLLSVPIANSFSWPLRHLAQFAQRAATDKPQLESEVIERQDEIGVLAQELNHMTAILKANLAEARLQIEERQRAEAALRQAEEKYRSIFENATEGIFQTSPAGTYISANPALARIYGYDSREELIAAITDIGHQLYVNRDRRREFMEQIQEQGSVAEFESQIYRKDGSVIWISENARAVHDDDGKLRYYEGTVEDISDRKRFEAQLAFFANHDPLTGLFNRRYFQEELERQLSLDSANNQGAVLFLDLDDFKDINDTLGHLAGDELLKQLATLLRSQLRKTDILARLGGDEFAILLPRTSAKQVKLVAERLLETLWRQVVVFHDQPVQLSTSLGIALFPEHSTVGEELLAHADTAMYRAKDQGRNQLCFYVPDQNWQKRIKSKRAIKARIHEALENNLFVLYCQPILDLRHRQVTQYELLLRLQGEASNLISPNVFLPIAERYGLIQAIDRWVVVQAMQLIAERQRFGQRLTLEINLSGKSLADTELLSLIQEQLTSTEIDPQQLVFEITETAAIADLAQASKFMEFLKGLGCQFALDDFGIGYSSFFQLKSLPVDYLKIDGSFIRNLPQDQVDRHLVKAIVDVSRGLGKRTIAEFVGSEATTELLSDLGVDYAQGYYIGPPQPVSEVLLGALSTQL